MIIENSVSKKATLVLTYQFHILTDLLFKTNQQHRHTLKLRHTLPFGDDPVCAVHVICLDMLVYVLGWLVQRM